MQTPGSERCFLNWAKERTEEMDATLASLEGRLRQLKATVRADPTRFVAQLRAQRDAFRDAVAKQTQVDKAESTRAAKELEAQWTAFENDVDLYFEHFGKQIEQQQATFRMLAAVQMKAWRDVADTLQQTTHKFATDQRRDIDGAVTLIKIEVGSGKSKARKTIGIAAPAVVYADRRSRRNAGRF